MPNLSYKKFQVGLKKNKERIFLFNGDENFLKNEGISSIMKKYEGTYDEDFDLYKSEGKDVGDEEIAAELDAASMFNENKFVIIENVDKCPIKTKNVIKKWLENPNEGIIALFSTSEKVSAKKVKFFEQFEKYAVCINCSKLEYDDLIKWIPDRFEQLNKKIDEESIKFMIDMVGFDLYKMNNEIKKISILVQQRENVILEDVKKVVSDIRDDSVFDLVDAIINKNVQKSLKMIFNVIKDRSDQAILLVSLLLRQFKQISMFIDLNNKGFSEIDMAQKIGINPYFLKDIRIQANKLKDSDIFKMFNKLLLTDLKLKSSPLSCNAVIESLVLEFCAACD